MTIPESRPKKRTSKALLPQANLQVSDLGLHRIISIMPTARASTARRPTTCPNSIERQRYPEVDRRPVQCKSRNI